MFRYCQSFPSSEKCGPFRSSAGILEEVEAVNDRYMRGSLAPWKTGMLPVTGLKEGDGTAGAAVVAVQQINSQGAYLSNGQASD